MKVWKQFWQQNKEKKLIITAAILLLCVAVASFCLGSVTLSLSQIWEGILSFGAEKMSGAGNILWKSRFPRTIACIASGAALAVSGAVIQGVLANKLASPSIIGVNAGAGFAYTLCLAAGAVSGWVYAGATFCGALVVVVLVSVTAQKMNASRTTVILGGVAINSMFSAATEALTTVNKDLAAMSADFRIGGFASVHDMEIIPAVILIVIALILIMSLHNELDLMTLGEEMAQGLGLSVRKMRTVFLILAALLAGASVSFAGLLGFVGLIVPHMMRMLVGGESRYLVPMCALGGGIFVTVCDIFARRLFSPFEVPVGVFLSFIGGPFFIWMLFRKRGGRF